MLVHLHRRITRRPTLRLAVALAIALTASLAACNDSTAPEEEEEPEVASMRLTFGNGTTLTVTGAGATPSVRIPVGATTVAAQFLRADGSADPVVTATTFRLEVAGLAGGVTFARSGAFGGTLNATTATSTNIPITFSLFHIEEQHDDFGPFTVNVTVGP